MTVDNYEKAKERLVTMGTREPDGPMHIAELKKLYNQTAAEDRAKSIIARYGDDPEALKIAYETLRPSKSQQRDDLGRYSNDEPTQDLFTQ